MLTQFKLQTGFIGILSTFSNNRYGNGKVYSSSGFTLDHVTAPGFYYFKNKGLENRKNYQKHKLAKLFNLDPSYVDKRTGPIIMKEQGYSTVWDAGHTVWTKIIN